MARWYEELFVNSAKSYDEECFTQGASGECDFIECETGHDRSVRILDIGCGTGRHSIELASRGYNLVGIDLSESQLERARSKASSRGVQVDFRKIDARELPFEGGFGLAIMLCEGAFPLMETDEMNYSILQGAARALEPGGKFIFTTLNGLYPLFHSVKEMVDSGAGGIVSESSNKFDLMTFRDHSTLVATDDSGVRRELVCDERYYVPCEITWLLRSLGFDTVDIFGARLGAFSRGDQLTTEDFEMLVVAVKAPATAGLPDRV